MDFSLHTDGQWIFLNTVSTRCANCNPTILSRKQAKEQMDIIMKPRGDGWLHSEAGTLGPSPVLGKDPNKALDFWNPSYSHK